MCCLEIFYGDTVEYLRQKLYAMDRHKACDEILIDHSMEGGVFQTHPGFVDMNGKTPHRDRKDFFTELHQLCEETNVCPSKVKVTWGNANIEQQYAEWCKRNNPPVKFKSVYYYPACLGVLLRNTTPHPEYYNELRNIKRPKLFTYLSGDNRPHRAECMNALYKRGMLDQIEWTWLGDHIGQGIKSPGLHADLKPLVPKSADGLQGKVATFTKNPGAGFYEMYKATYFDLIPETYYWHDREFYPNYYWWKTVDISEKLWRSVINKRPFIVLGNQYVLREFKKLGFKTFPSMFDETYDTLPDSKRLDFIKDYVTTLTIDKLHKALYSPEVEDALEHNLEQVEVMAEKWFLRE